MWKPDQPVSADTATTNLMLGQQVRVRQVTGTGKLWPIWNGAAMLFAGDRAEPLSLEIGPHNRHPKVVGRGRQLLLVDGPLAVGAGAHHVSPTINGGTHPQSR